MSFPLPPIEYEMPKRLRETWSQVFREAGFDLQYYVYDSKAKESRWPPLLSDQDHSYGGVIMWSGSVIGIVMWVENKPNTEFAVFRISSTAPMGWYIHYALLVCGARCPRLSVDNSLSLQRWLEIIGDPIAIYRFAHAISDQELMNPKLWSPRFEYIAEADKPQGVFPYGQIYTGPKPFLRGRPYLQICGGPVPDNMVENTKRFVVLHIGNGTSIDNATHTELGAIMSQTGGESIWKRE
ncbi:MAG: hypothetical protein JXM70_14590 [Pirellulales bacterium]|nr:hypothetical protein [Pirellulales bacterium]